MIPPAISLGINAFLAVLTTLGASTATDPATQKIVLWSGAASTILNAILHAFSSSQAGPAVSAPPKA